jgi:hypothetical protein
MILYRFGFRNASSSTVSCVPECLSEVFFSEEKKQKTFGPLSRAHYQLRDNGPK